MSVAIGSVVAIIGAILGSFLGVVVTRYGTREGFVSGRSRCDACRKNIAWYDNIPLISFILLRGRCRHCGANIAAWVAAIEWVTAAVSVAVVYCVLQLFPETAVRDSLIILTMAAALIVVAFYDLRTMYVPLRAVFVADAALVMWWSVHPPVWGDVIGGALIAGGVPAFLSIVSRERWMGSGDAYISVIGGALFGVYGAVLYLTVAFGLGAVIGIALIIAGIKTRRDPIPFGPFLVCAIGVLAVVQCVAPSALRYGSGMVY